VPQIRVAVRALADCLIEVHRTTSSVAGAGSRRPA
jgi:hypothetical protein